MYSAPYTKTEKSSVRRSNIQWKLSQTFDMWRFQGWSECLLWNRTIWRHLHLWRHKGCPTLRLMRQCRRLRVVGFFPSNRENPWRICKGSLEWTLFCCGAVQPARTFPWQGDADYCWWSWWTHQCQPAAIQLLELGMESSQFLWKKIKSTIKKIIFIWVSNLLYFFKKMSGLTLS